MMKLHSSLGPNPRMVRMVLAEKGLAEGEDFERQHYDIVAGENRSSDDYLEKNPLGTMPTLELDDGTCLTESWPICEYIEEQHPEPNLIGKNATQRAQVRKWCRLIDQEVVVPMTMGFRATGGRPMFEPRLRVLSKEAGADIFAYADDSLRWLDGEFEARDHLALGRFTLADILLFCFIKFGMSVGWKPPEGTNNLTRFVETHAARGSAKVWQEAE